MLPVRLLKAAYAKGPRFQQLGKFVPFTFSTLPGEISIAIKDHKKVLREEPLFITLQDHINPGYALCPAATGGDPGQQRQYRMKNIAAENLQGHASQRAGKASFLSTTYRLSVNTSTHTFVELMALMYRALKHRKTVEIQIFYQDEDTGFPAFRKDDEGILKRRSIVEEMFKQNLHFLPEVMVGAMPEGSGIKIDPQICHEKRIVAWAIAPAHEYRDGYHVPPYPHTRLLLHKQGQLGEKSGMLADALPPVYVRPGDDAPGVFEATQPEDVSWYDQVDQTLETSRFEDVSWDAPEDASEYPQADKTPETSRPKGTTTSEDSRNEEAPPTSNLDSTPDEKDSAT